MEGRCEEEEGRGEREREGDRECPRERESELGIISGQSKTGHSAASPNPKAFLRTDSFPAIDDVLSARAAVEIFWACISILLSVGMWAA